MQKSCVVPHFPQMLQHAFSGQGLSEAQSTLLLPAGFFVPGFVGPQTAEGTAAGNGGSPSLTQNLARGNILLQLKPYVFLLKDSSSASVRSCFIAIKLQYSPC
jgi:hypothetical protein